MDKESPYYQLHEYALALVGSIELANKGVVGDSDIVEAIANINKELVILGVMI